MSDSAGQSAADLSIDDLSARHGELEVLSKVTCRAAPGTILTLLGPSGCGKSTLLRVIAGLHPPASGDVRIDGRSVIALPPGKRDVALVFQNYALYPHLTVRKNLTLALEARRVARLEIARRIEEAAKLLGIADILERKPGALSGGQQQRAALGRALVRVPRLYLLDEPLSNLDALLREEMRSELKTLFRRLGATVVYVTHDQTEALTLADTMVVLERGQVRQAGTPDEIYRYPVNLFVATFVGTPRINVLHGRAEQGGLEVEGIKVPGGAPAAEGQAVVLGIRPEDVEVVEEGAAGTLAAEVRLVESLGSQLLLTLAMGAAVVRALVSIRAPSARVGIRLPPERRHWFEAESGKRIESGEQRR